MPIPETTSAEAFWRYAGGKCLFESQGEAWKDIKAWLTVLPPVVETLHIPSVSEPFLAWTTSGKVDFQEREDGQPWGTNRIKKGSFFLTTGGGPYDVRWRAVSPGPFETMLVFIELPVLQRALEEVFCDEATQARLRDASAFDDEALNSLLGLLREELMRPQAMSSNLQRPRV
jgi:AraC family transcriptional regulator